MRNPGFTQYMKIGMALLLLLCFVLPFSSCTVQFDENGQYAFLSKKPTVREVVQFNYPWEKINRLSYDDYTAWLFLSCFIWPIPLLLIQLRSKQKKIVLLVWALEPLFAAGAATGVYVNASILAEPEVGARLMLAAYCIYFSAWIAEATKKIRGRKRNKFSRKARGQVEPPLPFIF